MLVTQTRLSSGFATLDRLLGGGFCSGDFVLVFSKRGGGRTAFLNSIVKTHVAYAHRGSASSRRSSLLRSHPVSPAGFTDMLLYWCDRNRLWVDGRLDVEPTVGHTLDGVPETTHPQMRIYEDTLQFYGVELGPQSGFTAGTLVHRGGMGMHYHAHVVITLEQPEPGGIVIARVVKNRHGNFGEFALRTCFDTSFPYFEEVNHDGANHHPDANTVGNTPGQTQASPA